MPRVIKRYDNRKLYDLQDRRYVSLKDVADLVRAGESVLVQDNATGADLTAATLTKAVLEDDSSNSQVFSDFLHAWLRSGEAGAKKAADWVLERSLERLAPVREVRREMKNLQARLAELEQTISELERKRRSK
jgi:polyhydroxyalkanoate synthesis repressor PhaR